ncbi:MAG: hypothetical protein JWN25_1273 [Verrucomicrobiales bacterium]|nr:hypothetical protein [Verrucomicrobiales bacterium]
MKIDEKANSSAIQTETAYSPQVRRESQPAIHQESATTATTSVDLSNFPAMFTEKKNPVLLQNRRIFHPTTGELPGNLTALKQYLIPGRARTLTQLSTKTNGSARIVFDLCKKFQECMLRKGAARSVLVNKKEAASMGSGRFLACVRLSISANERIARPLVPKMPRKNYGLTTTFNPLVFKEFKRKI